MGWFEETLGSWGITAAAAGAGKLMVYLYRQLLKICRLLLSTPVTGKFIWHFPEWMFVLNIFICTLYLYEIILVGKYFAVHYFSSFTGELLKMFVVFPAVCLYFHSIPNVQNTLLFSFLKLFTPYLEFQSSDIQFISYLRSVNFKV